MNTKITKSNSIVNASYRLSLNEMRILLYGLSKINPMSDELPLLQRIRVKDLAEFYCIGEKDRGSFYDDIKHALVNKFWEREFSYFDEKRGAVVKRRWLIEVEYGAKDGSLACHYNPLIKDQLQNLSKRFTSYFLSNVANMKSAYSMRIYEISIMHLNASAVQKTVFTKTIKDLKYYLDVGDKYKRMHNFKARVLEPSKKEINKHSDIKINYEVIKQGKSPYEIKFTVTRKKETRQPLKISLSAIEEAQNINAKFGSILDIYAVEQQFYEYSKTKGLPKNTDSAFIGFVKKKLNP